MPDPRPHAPATDGTEVDSQGQLDPTLAPAAGAGAPGFGPPQHPGEVGTLGRFRILQKLGQGGMGAVYLGYDVALERKVALKVMLRSYAADPDARARFLREARAAAKIKSDHVVTIHDVGEAGVPFIAMEYLLGFPLDQFLKTKGELPLAHALRVTRETALGLAAAHDLGLVHRDIKPGNLWLEAPRGRVKLLDFGLARVMTDDTNLTGTGTVIGTPAYMSPEQARGLKVDHRSDLFSLGVMLYRLTTGKMPFAGDTTISILTSLAVDTPRPAREHNPRIPDALAAVVAKLLAKNPADRFQTAAAVIDALAAAERTASGGPVPVSGAPLLIGAQTQNVWEGVDDSQSIAVPLAEDDTALPLAEDATGPLPAAVRRSPRAEAERKPSKVPAALALVAVLVACAALLAFLLWPAKGTLVVESDDPDAELVIKQGGAVVRGRTKDRTIELKAGTYTAALVEPKPGRKLVPDTFEITGKGQARVRVERELAPPKPTPRESDRRPAEYALEVGGWVSVDGEARKITTAADLPKGPFALTLVSFRDNKAVTDVGLEHFKDCKSLTILNLSGTSVTDAGLAHVKGCVGLSHLELNGTPVTAAMIEELHRALPKCQIIHTVE